MLITSLSVEGIGRFASAARVDGFGTGVNVLAAGNEVGKSTLFKAIRTCLFCRHDSKTQEIRELGSDDSQLPATVELAFEHDGKHYKVRKSFLRSPSAVLTENGREIARFTEADKAVWDILGISPGSGRSIDEGAFGLLWVGQGSSFMAPVLGTGASSLLNAAVESEVGALVGGERARRAIDDINAELRRNLTDSERGPRSAGPLSRAQDNLRHWREVEADRLTKLSALEQQFAELTQRRRRHRQITDPAAMAQMTQELTGARNSLREAQAADQEIRRLEAETDAAKRALEGAAQRLRLHREVASRIDTNRRLEANLAQSLPEHRSQEQEARGSLARTEEQRAKAESEAKTLAIGEQQLERLAGALVRAARKYELARRLAGRCRDESHGDRRPALAGSHQAQDHRGPRRTRPANRRTRCAAHHCGRNAGRRGQPGGRRTGARRLSARRGHPPRTGFDADESHGRRSRCCDRHAGRASAAGKASNAGCRTDRPLEGHGRGQHRRGALASCAPT